MTSPYDAFAWFYDRYWAAPMQQWQRPALERLLFTDLAPGAAILDLCCGTGKLAQELLLRGYAVTGIDSSPEMLVHARENAPDALFLPADAARFTLDSPVDATVSVFDSLNHLMEAEQLQLAFHNIHEALKPGGILVFDVNTAAAYGEQWDESAWEVQPDHAFFLRGGFDSKAQIGATSITMFRLEGSWQRSDVEMRQRPWELSEIEPMLQTAGFQDIRSYRAIEDLGMPGHFGIGRLYFRACRNSNMPSASSS
jgi:SAM-dependent methyltransferase